ncbi:MAG: pseudouridine synthase [Acidobacteriota bacterium]
MSDSQPELLLLYRDKHLLAVSKPSGLAVHRGWSQDRITALPLARRMAGCRVHPIHRLDRPTSGVLLFALDQETTRRVQRSFEAAEVTKRYLALVRGIPPQQGVIDHPVPRTPRGERVPAITEFRRLGSFERFSLVEARPRTGRLHQIRRHLKHLTHPLVGDVRYGKGDINRHFRQRFGLHRLALHALELSLPHPYGGDFLSLRAPLPEDLEGPLRAMGLWPTATLDGPRQSLAPAP